MRRSPSKMLVYTVFTYTLSGARLAARSVFPVVCNSPSDYELDPLSRANLATRGATFFPVACVSVSKEASQGTQDAGYLFTLRTYSR